MNHAIRWLLSVATLLPLACSEVEPPRAPGTDARTLPALKTRQAPLTTGYCPSDGGSTEYESLANVKVTAKAGGGYDYSFKVVLANPESCTPGNPCPSYDEHPIHYAMWADLNGDQQFSAGEAVANGQLTGYQTVNYQGNLEVSGTLQLNSALPNVVVRTAIAWKHVPVDPCATSWTWGDVGDTVVAVSQPTVAAIIARGPSTIACAPYKKFGTGPSSTAGQDPTSDWAGQASAPLVLNKKGTFTVQLQNAGAWDVKTVAWTGDVAPKTVASADGKYEPTLPKHTTGAQKELAVTATVTLQPTGQPTAPTIAVSRTSRFLTFFHRCSDDNADGIHNWYEYWLSSSSGATVNQLGKSTAGDGAVTTPYKSVRYGGGSYGASLYGDTTTTVGDAINIYNLAAMNCAYNVTSTSGGQTSNFSTLGQGVDCVAHTMKHEECHQTLNSKWAGPWKFSTDTDGDRIPDNVELQASWSGHGFKHNDKKSFAKAHPSFGISTGDDEEAYCELTAYGTSATHAKDYGVKGKNGPAGFQYRRKVVETGLSAQLTGTLSDTVEDLDDDGLFDTLTLSVGVQVASAGTYSLHATFDDAADGVIWAEANSVLLMPGLQTVDLHVPGHWLRTRRVAGALELRTLLLMSATGVDRRAQPYATSPVVPEAFAPYEAGLSGPLGESLVDIDGEPGADRLDIGVFIAGEPGSYTLSATLVGDGRAIASAHSEVIVGPQQTIATLSFDGRSIRAANVETLTVPSVRLENDEGRVIDVWFGGWELSTTGGSFGPASVWVGSSADWGDDWNGDGRYNRLHLEFPLSGADGDYRVLAALRAGDNVRVQSTGTVNISGGTGTAELEFETAALQASGIPGPFHIEHVVVLDAGGHIVAAPAPSLTLPYLPEQLAAAPVRIESVGDDSPVDLDADGLFDELHVPVTLQPSGAGWLTVRATLATSDGQPIAHTHTGVAASGATPEVAILRFDGRLIEGLAVDGPFVVTAVEARHSGDPALVATTADRGTGPWSASAFTPGAVVMGTVFSAEWSPAMSVRVHARNTAGEVIADVVTDAFGTYRLVAGDGGAWTVEVDTSGAVSPPIWVVDDAVAPATGSAQLLNVVPGEPTAADIHFAPLDGSPPTIDLIAPFDGQQLDVGELVPVDFATTDNLSGVQTITVSLDGLPLALPATLSHETLTVGEHTLTVDATDKAGNHATASAVFTLVAPETDAPPTVVIDSPLPGEYPAHTLLPLKATAQDDQTDLVVEWRLDGALLAAETDELDTTDLALGGHSLLATVTDASGQTASDTVQFTLVPSDTPLPTVQLVSPRPTRYGLDDLIPVDVSAPDTDTLALYINGQLRPLDADIPASALGVGAHTAELRWTDGELTRRHRLIFHVDDRRDVSGPTVWVDSPTHGRYALDSLIPVVVHATDPFGVAELTTYLDGRPFTRDYLRASALGPGTYEFKVKAVDANGLTTTHALAFEIVATAPQEPSETEPVPMDSVTSSQPVNPATGCTTTMADGSPDKAPWLFALSLLASLAWFRGRRRRSRSTPL